MVQPIIPKAVPGNYDSIAAQYARAKAIKNAEDAAKVKSVMKAQGLGEEARKKTPIEKLNEIRERAFKREWGSVVGFFLWLL